jgi:hypothetical protein
MRRVILRLLPVLGLVCAGAWFLAGITWGLPSRRADAYLFGDPSKAWTGKQIIELAGGWEENTSRGADVDLNPVAGREQPVVLNATDAQRAEIVRRYRLFSYQPDEMITFRALAQMRPAERKFDPRLYQYGGLWVYPVGGLLKAASILKLVRVQSDLSFYLDHPEEFGRFYVVARLYSAMWGVVGVWAVYRLVKRLTAATDMAALAPYAAGACFAAMPVVVNMAHEAKPHLAGTVLVLLAVLAASDYVTTGRRRSWLAAGALCGAAFGMVLSTLPVFVILPIMALLRRGATWRDRVVVALASVVIGIDVYFLTNPYVLIHLVRRDPVLQSNLGNSAAMYTAGSSAGAAVNAALLVAEAMGTLLAVVGVLSALWLGRRAIRMRKDVSPEETSRRAAGLLLAAPALLVLVQFVALAAGKPGEYARFALLPCVFLMVEAVVGVTAFDHRFGGENAGRRRPGPMLFLILFVWACLPTAAYVQRFVDDASDAPTRFQAAARLAELPDSIPIAVEAEPAPYSLPPVDVFTHPIVLLPRGGKGPTAAEGRGSAGLRVRPVDVPGGNVIPPADRSERRHPTRISWAGKYFEVAPVVVPGATE